MRVSDEGERRAFFHSCPDCGSTVFYTMESSPGVVAVPAVRSRILPSLHRRFRYGRSGDIRGCGFRTTLSTRTNRSRDTRAWAAFTSDPRSGVAGLPLSVPGVETRTNRLDCGLPEPAFIFRSPLIQAAERAVAQGFPPRLRISVLRPHDRRLALCRHHDSRKPRPREVLLLRRMVVLRIDCGRNLVRSPFPKLVPDNRRARPALCPRPPRLGVSPMSVHNEDPHEPLADQ